MRLGENYLANNPDPREEKLDVFRTLWRAALATTQTFTWGDDLSHYNTITDWTAKQAAMKFSVLKMGEGNSPNQDSKLTEFLNGAKASGTIVMGYWFVRSNVSGTLQRDYSLNIAGVMQSILGYKPFLWADVETSDSTANSTRISRLGDLLAGWDVYNPGRVGLYSSPGFANTYLTPVPTYVNLVKQWVAHWTSAALPTQPNGWNAANRLLWQTGSWDNYAWCPEVPGSISETDTNKFFGTEQDLQNVTGANPPWTIEQRLAYLETFHPLHP